MVRAGFTDLAQELDEVLGVAVGHVHADEAQGAGHREDLAGLGEVLLRGAGGDHYVAQQGRVGLIDEGLPLRKAVVLVHRRHHLEAGQGTRHGEAADGIHVGGDDGHALPSGLGVLEGELAGQADLGTALESRALGAKQDILETELQVFFDTHCEFLIEPCVRGHFAVATFRQAQKNRWFSGPPVYSSVGKNPVRTRLIIHAPLW